MEISPKEKSSGQNQNWKHFTVDSIYTKSTLVSDYQLLGAKLSDVWQSATDGIEKCLCRLSSRESRRLWARFSIGSTSYGMNADKHSRSVFYQVSSENVFFESFFIPDSQIKKLWRQTLLCFDFKSSFMDVTSFFTGGCECHRPEIYWVHNLF